MVLTKLRLHRITLQKEVRSFS